MTRSRPRLLDWIVNKNGFKFLEAFLFPLGPGTSSFAQSMVPRVTYEVAILSYVNVISAPESQWFQRQGELANSLPCFVGVFNKQWQGIELLLLLWILKKML